MRRKPSPKPFSTRFISHFWFDAELRVLSANRSFYETFKVDPGETQGCPLYELGEGQRDIPALRSPLETVIPEKVAMDGFEVEHDFLGLGQR